MAEKTTTTWAFTNEIGTYGDMPIKDASVQEVAQVDLKEISSVNPAAAEFMKKQMNGGK